MICMLQISQVFPPALPIPNQSALPPLPTYCPDCCVYRPWKSLCMKLPSFVAYYQHPTLYHRIKATKLIATLQLSELV